MLIITARFLTFIQILGPRSRNERWFRLKYIFLRIQTYTQKRYNSTLKFKNEGLISHVPSHLENEPNLSVRLSFVECLGSVKHIPPRLQNISARAHVQFLLSQNKCNGLVSASRFVDDDTWKTALYKVPHVPSYVCELYWQKNVTRVWPFTYTIASNMANNEMMLLWWKRREINLKNYN